MLTFSQFRTKDDYEVDLFCESDDGRIAGIQVKAGSEVEDKDFRGLRILRDKLGDEFVGGVVLHLGIHSYTREDRIYVLPLDRLWD